MKNKKAKQSAIDTYSFVYLNSKLNSKKYHWSFDRLRNAECGFRRSENHMRFKEFDLVSIGDL